MASYYKQIDEFIENLRCRLRTYHEVVTNNPHHYSAELIARLNPDLKISIFDLGDASRSLKLTYESVRLHDDETVVYFFHRNAWLAVYPGVVLP